MASSYTLLANLRAGRCSNTAEVRLLRFWEARNINKGGELISVDMLFIDDNINSNDIKNHTFSQQTISMASSYTLLANLRAGRCSNTAEVRLLRFWEARNINKGGELISVDMLFIDDNVRPAVLSSPLMNTVFDLIIDVLFLIDDPL
ncbi:hypothetical protein F2Q70_00000713 [Brassica cretica]|uniref:Uncharacterized protein n=1 Tax=Brassica cretica TaxID=69181 RepID=A0A8S9IU72_BRACR|nr:hypothetical protein F2Q70_00000713 [Brassica cretica]